MLKENFIKKLTYLILIIVLVGYFGVGYYVYDVSGGVPCATWEGEKNNSPSSFSIPEEYSIDQTPFFIPSYENVSIESTDGVTLSGWWMERNPGGPTVVVIHGLTSSKYSSGILLSSGILYHNGFNVLAFDLRDHGDSTCEDGYYSAGQKESDDSAAAIDWLIDIKGINPNNIGLYGQSLGALTALQTGAKTQSFSAIAVHDPPVDFETLVREEMVYQGFPEFLFEPTKHYAQIFEGINITKITPKSALENGNKQPILVFNGLQDARVQPHHTDDLIKIANDNNIPITVYRYEDAGHVQSIWIHTDEFSEALVDFFQSNISS